MRWMIALLLLPLAGCLDGTDLTTDDQNSSVDPEVLSWLDPVALVCPTDNPAYVVFGVQAQDCAGFGEPTLEVAGDGTIWYSSVCCVGQSPPIWRSFDGGLTFEAYPFANGTGLVRDAAGVEGDFAIDEAGNVYFFDITAATAYITKFSADGTHQHTKPDVFPPLVDRPWIRAGAEDEVFIFYNTAAAGTNFYRSTDGGLTWDYPGYTNFPCALMAFGQGLDRDHMVVGGCPGNPVAYITTDAGASWTNAIDLPLPDGWAGSESYMQGSIDDVGNAYVPVTASNGEQSSIFVYQITPAGTVNGPFNSTPQDGFVDKPWSIAGEEGVYAQAYYAARNVDDVANAEWYLTIDFTHDGGQTWETVIADEKPVLEGAFGRNLGDFLQLRQAENGDLVVAYAAREDGQLVNYFVRSSGMNFGHVEFTNG